MFYKLKHIVREMEHMKKKDNLIKTQLIFFVLFQALDLLHHIMSSIKQVVHIAFMVIKCICGIIVRLFM